MEDLFKTIDEGPSYTFKILDKVQEVTNFKINIDDSDETDKNIEEKYKNRIEMGGWKEEVWYSYYRIGLCYKKMDKIIIEEAPIVILFYDKITRFTQKNIQGLGINPLNNLNLKRVKKIE